MFNKKGREGGAPITALLNAKPVQEAVYGMMWLLGLAGVSAVVGLLVFVLMRDSFRAGRTEREKTPPRAAPATLPSLSSPASNTEDDTRLNTLAQTLQAQERSEAPLLPPAEHAREENLLDDPDRIRGNPVLPQAPQRYLRMVTDHDDSVDQLLNGRVHRGYSLPSREFRIERTEERHAPGAAGKTSGRTADAACGQSPAAPPPDTEKTRSAQRCGKPNSAPRRSGLVKRTPSS